MTLLKKTYKFLSQNRQSLFLEYKVDMKPRYGHGKPAHKELYEIIDANKNFYKML